MRSLLTVAVLGLALFLFMPSSAQAQFGGGAGPSYYYGYYNGMPYSSLVFRSPYTGYTFGRVTTFNPYAGYNTGWYNGFVSPYTGQYFPGYSTPNLPFFPGQAYYGPSYYYLPSYSSMLNQYSPYSPNSMGGGSGYNPYWWLY